jgi:defect-in-organelle-trafficking protein DotC
LGGALVSCAMQQRSFDTTNLNDLRNLSQQATLAGKPTVGKIRLEALKDTALSIGAQGGLAHRARQIDKILLCNSRDLTNTYDFNNLILDKNVLPPVLEYSEQSLNLASPDIIRVSDNIYKIIKQAHFVTTAPTWRDYLWLSYKKPALPDSTLLPRDKRERKIWKEYIDIGWKNGMKQADTIHANGLAELKRDFQGMMLYRKLLSQNMVSKPFVAEANIGVTSNVDRSEIRVNDRVLRITAIPKLNPNSKQWRSTLVTGAPRS